VDRRHRESRHTEIEKRSLDGQAQILAPGLTTASAIAFFDALPQVEVLMPSLEMASMEEMLAARKGDDRSRRLGYYG